MQQLSSPRLRERRSCSSAVNSTSSFEFLSDGKFIKYLGIKSLNTFPHIQLGLMSGTKCTRVQIQHISILDFFFQTTKFEEKLSFGLAKY